MNTTINDIQMNGINAQAQAATTEAIRQRPQLRGVEFRAQTRWTGGARTTTTAKNFAAAGCEHPRRKVHHTFSDLPAPFHGSDQAATPAELALHALAACLTSTLVYHCSVRDIRVRSVTTEIEATLDACGFLRIDDEVDPGFNNVTVTLHADTDSDLAELQDIVDHAPMLDVFKRPIPVQATVLAGK